MSCSSHPISGAFRVTGTYLVALLTLSCSAAPPAVPETLLGGSTTAELVPAEVQATPQGAVPSGEAAKAEPEPGKVGTGSGEGDTTQPPPGVLPLPATGIASEQELARCQAELTDPEKRKQFEEAFRLTFTLDKASRNGTRARALLDALIESMPKHACSFRTRGYVHINNGFDVDSAIADYTRAIEHSPNYGEAHYALAFAHTVRDAAQGQVHFQKAMELGIRDERNLGPRFFPTVKVAPATPPE